MLNTKVSFPTVRRRWLSWSVGHKFHGINRPTCLLASVGGPADEITNWSSTMTSNLLGGNLIASEFWRFQRLASNGQLILETATRQEAANRQQAPNTRLQTDHASLLSLLQRAEAQTVRPKDEASTCTLRKKQSVPADCARRNGSHLGRSLDLFRHSSTTTIRRASYPCR
jgi:hypothetical protein